MKVYVMNSSMMPCEGTYHRRDLSHSEAREFLSRATEIVSTIGYRNVVDIIKDVTGIEVPFDEAKPLTRLEEDFCHIFVAKLRYRVETSRKGSHIPSKDDYEFCLVTFTR